MDNPNPAPAPAPELGGDADFGGDEGGFGDEGGDKPFDEEPFDAGVDADETEDPKNYIQQLSGKLGQSLRAYEKEVGEPDFELEKFAINSVLSATNTGEMDTEDQKDIISKVKTSGLDNDLEGDLDVEPEGEPAPEPEPDMPPEPEGEELGVEEALNEFGGGPPEDREYDAMQAYHDSKGQPQGGKSNYHVSVDKKGNFKVGEPEKRFPSGKIVNGERVSDKWGKTEQVSEEISIFEDRIRGVLNENLKYPTREVRTDRKYLGATIWGDSGAISLDIYSHSHNPYGGSGWKKIQSGGGISIGDFTKDYIARQVAERYKNPESFDAEIDELLMKVDTSYKQMMQDMNPEIAEPEVQPKRKEEQAPKRIKERDLPFRKPVRETKTKPKATV